MIKLQNGEQIIWEGKPAPRCYTFRHWRHSIFGLFFLLVSVAWQSMGIVLSDSVPLGWMTWVPVPFIIIGVYFSVGHLLQARLEWSHVWYAVTDSRIIAVRGLLKRSTASMSLRDVIYFKMRPLGEHLGTLQIQNRNGSKILFHCLEHPKRLTDHLENVIKENISSL